METDEEKDHWLEQASENGWTISQMRKAIKGDVESPTPPTEIDQYIAVFNDFRVEQIRHAEQFRPHERLQISQMLRDLADDIESLETD